MNSFTQLVETVLGIGVESRQLTSLQPSIRGVIVRLPGVSALHPRVANEQHGPTVQRQLEPPGFMGLHYGIRTPISVVFAPVIFGVILGAF